MPQTTPLDLLKTYFGYDRFLPLQEEIIAGVLEGRESLVLMPTGGGKSLCYQLPALYLDGLTLVISPLIALMKDQVDGLRANGIAADFINSSLSQSDVSQVRARISSGKTKILYLAPERLALSGFQHFLSDLDVRLIAIDEAHCISEWGHDFRPDYRNLKSLRKLLPGVPMIALTATATEKVRQDIVEQLELRQPEIFLASLNRPNLSYAVRPKRRSFDALLDLLKSHRGEPAIVYRFSRKDTESLAAKLSGQGFPALPYHAGLDASVRRDTQEQFIRDEVPIVVATIAFGMGIDKPDIRVVVHFDLPKSIEGYFQETGRAGRDGLPAECVLFFSYHDRMKQEFFIKEIEDRQERENASQKLRQMIELCEIHTCRRRYLLDYFGERWDKDNCGGCDICLTAGEEFDATEISQKILSAVIRTGERFGAQHVTDVLLGANTKKVRELGHDRLSVHGIVRDLGVEEIRHTVGLLVDQGLLVKEAGDYPTLSVTGEGRKFLNRRAQLTLTRPKPEVGVRAGRDSGQLDYDRALFQQLRVLRKQIADRRGVPPFVVFGDVSLQQMAYYFPQSNQSFSGISGVGSTKLEEFGDRFLQVIRDHAHKNGLAERQVPSSRRERRRPAEPRDTTYHETKRLVDQWMPIAKIADLRGLSKATIASHLERLIEAGEMLDLSHILPPLDRVSAIEAAFKSTGSYLLSPARKLLGDGYPYEEIRLVRMHLRLRDREHLSAMPGS